MSFRFVDTTVDGDVGTVTDRASLERWKTYHSSRINPVSHSIWPIESDEAGYSRVNEMTNETARQVCIDTLVDFLATAVDARTIESNLRECLPAAPFITKSDHPLNKDEQQARLVSVIAGLYKTKTDFGQNKRYGIFPVEVLNFLLGNQVSAFCTIDSAMITRLRRLMAGSCRPSRISRFVTSTLINQLLQDPVLTDTINQQAGVDAHSGHRHTLVTVNDLKKSQAITFMTGFVDTPVSSDKTETFKPSVGPMEQLTVVSLPTQALPLLLTHSLSQSTVTTCRAIGHEVKNKNVRIPEEDEFKAWWRSRQTTPTMVLEIASQIRDISDAVVKACAGIAIFEIDNLIQDGQITPKSTVDDITTTLDQLFDRLDGRIPGLWHLAVRTHGWLYLLDRMESERWTLAEADC